MRGIGPIRVLKPRKHAAPAPPVQGAVKRVSLVNIRAKQRKQNALHVPPVQRPPLEMLPLVCRVLLAPFSRVQARPFVILARRSNSHPLMPQHVPLVSHRAAIWQWMESVVAGVV